MGAEAEHIYLQVSEVLDAETQSEVRDDKYVYPWKDGFLRYALKKIFETDPAAFAEEDRRRIEKQGPVSVIMGTAVGEYHTESFLHFRGDGDRVAKALAKIFNYRAEPQEPVLVKVSEQLNADPVLEEAVHPSFAEGDNEKKRLFGLSVVGSLSAYMKRHP